MHLRKFLHGREATPYKRKVSDRQNNMALINQNDTHIIYESLELIADLKQDILEFGNDYIVAVWYKEIDGVTIYTNYDFINEDSPIDQSELQEEEKIKPMTMGALLVALEQQNSMF